jgi:hypothetical protein
MIINDAKQLEDAKKMVDDMIKESKNDFVKNSLIEMKEELNRYGIECNAPSYFSIYRFGYDIFNPLHAVARSI